MSVHNYTYKQCRVRPEEVVWTVVADMSPDTVYYSLHPATSDTQLTNNIRREVLCSVYSYFNINLAD